jgi:hypothetical protein
MRYNAVIPPYNTVIMPRKATFRDKRAKMRGTNTKNAHEKTTVAAPGRVKMPEFSSTPPKIAKIPPKTIKYRVNFFNLTPLICDFPVKIAIDMNMLKMKNIREAMVNASVLTGL